MKSSYLPHATLAALLLAALLTLLAGVRMAREETLVRIEVGRGEVGDLSAEMMLQLRRLDALYSDHLRRLAQMDLKDRFELRRACDNVVGVRQFAVAVDAESGVKAEAVQENFEPGWRGVPILPGQPEPALSSDIFELSAEELSGAEEDHGWLEKPGQPLMFWQRRAPGVYAILTPDTDAVEAAVHGWLGEWLPEVLGPVAVTGATLRIAGAQGEIVSAEAESRPDVLVPLRSRFGSWDVAAWDERKTVVSHHAPTLAIAVGVAGVFALLGVGGFVVLRRALRLGEQRVSFVNRVSHELRTPLTNILLNSDLAADAVEVADERAASARLGVIREEAGRLSRLIANVLTFSRSGENEDQLVCEAFSVADCVGRTLAPFRASLGRKGIELEVEVGVELRAFGDADLAAQVLANLVSNVEKYAAGGGRLVIRGEADKQGCLGQVSLRVADAGPGIPDSSRERIFQPFVRLSQRVDEGVSGTGLGLSIARDLARRMGGDLRLESSDEGAVFVFSLPLAPGNVVAMEERKIS